MKYSILEDLSVKEFVTSIDLLQPALIEFGENDKAQTKGVEHIEVVAEDPTEDEDEEEEDTDEEENDDDEVGDYEEDDDEDEEEDDDEAEEDDDEVE